MALGRRRDDREAESYAKLTPKMLLLYVLIFAFCVIIISPLVIVFSSSLRTPGNQTTPLKLFMEFSLESYQHAFKNMNYPAEFLNSLMTTAGSVLIIIIVATMAAYPIGRIKTKLAKFMYYFFISGLIIPCSLPFSVFLFSGFMKSVPVEIEESAYMDGASLFKRFFTVVFPLLKPATVSAVITQGLWIWNDYFYPMVFISRQAQYSLPVGMLQFLGDKENPAQWNILFAACVLCALPLILIFMLLQKQFINGIAAGAVKG